MAEGADERTVRRARSPEDARALERFNATMALPLVLAALLPLLVMPGGQHNAVAIVVNVVAWIVFVVDFVVHERRLTHYLGTWLGRFDLFVVVVTAPWFLLFESDNSKFVLLIRLARIARVVMAGTGARRLFERLGRVAIVGVAVVFLGAAVAYRAEHVVNPEFKTYGDALWWAIVTITTVGYGDIVPITTAGRVVGVAIMVTGIAVLGVLAGSLASYFRISGAEQASSDPPSAEPAADVAGELAELRRQVASLTDAVSRLAPSGDGATDPAP